MGRFRDDPLGYARHVLKVEPYRTQLEIADALLAAPNMVWVPAAHSLGKTWTAAWLTSWWFDTRPEDSCVITTGPTFQHVGGVLWRELRQMRRRAGLGGFTGGRKPELYDGPGHFALGLTANKGESFTGRHLRHMLFVFDEGPGIDPIYYETTKTMFRAGGEHAWLVIGNPTDSSCQMYQEELSCLPTGEPRWRTLPMSADAHPNVRAGLLRRAGRGDADPIPNAVTLLQFEQWLSDWCDPLGAGDEADATDFQWPPEWWRAEFMPDQTPKFFRPGPLFECRALGRWPSAGTYGVWSDALWQQAARERPETFDPRHLPVGGCDVARMGDNYTVFHFRWGRTSFLHERHNGWGTDRTAGRLKQLCAEVAAFVNARRPAKAEPVRAEQIPVNIDEDGIGGAVLDLADEYTWHGVSGMAAPCNERDHFNTRTELWFHTAGLARKGLADFSRLRPEHRQLLRTQFMAPRWKVNASGQCQVERKEETVARLEGARSPDDADGANLAYREPPRPGPARVEEEDGPKQRSRAEERGLFGRRGR